MLTVDCRDIEPIKNELLVYVSDQVGAIPALKTNEFVLAPIDEEQTIDTREVITAIKEFLDSIGEGHNFAVITQQEAVVVKSIHGKVIERDAPPPAQMFSCTHCGFVTQYEVEHHNHMKIHYL